MTDSLVSGSLAMIRSSPKRRLPWPNLPSMGIRIDFILPLLVLVLFVPQLLRVLCGFFRRPPQGRTGHPDVMFPAKLAVLAGPVDGVAMHRCRIMTEALLVGIDLRDQIA